MKDEFLANPSHELRTPLAGIVGISEALMAGLGGRLSDAAAANLRLIVNSGRRLSNLVNDLLDYSRLRHKDIHLEIQPVNPVAAVGTVLALSRELTGGKQIDLIDTIPDDIPNVYADPQRLEQILFNLVGNAIKFTPHGSVTVSARELEDVVEIAVADTGIGMGPEETEEIFKPYEQASGGLAADTAGTGLGLSITRNLVELHHGRMRVDSVAGKGSCFRFTLPKTWEKPPMAEAAVVDTVVEGRNRRDVSSAAQPDAALDQPLRYSDPAPASLPAVRRANADCPWHVLVVDDEPINRHVITAHLSLANIPARTAASGAEALEALAQPEKPGVVLLDIMMPGMNGYEVCRRLRETHTPGDLPVIMLTAKNRMADLVEGFGSGANDYLTKPFLKEELIARVKTQFKLKQAFETLKENLHLKRELALRRQTELDLKLMQRRLAQMLHAIDEALVAVNAGREICFCNRSFEALTGYEAQELLGTSFHALFSDPDDRLRTAVDRILEETGQNSGKTRNFDGLAVNPVNGEPFEGNILATPLELEEEQLYLFIVRKLPAFANDLPAPAMDIIQNLNRNRQRLAALEKSLDRLDMGGPHQIKPVLDDLKAIDLLFERLDGQISAGDRHDLKQRLAVRVMNLALDYWTATTRTGKAALADRSRIWNIYFEKDGYARTQTLDRYLDLKALPRNPRWKQVCASADFVLADRTEPSALRDELEHALAQLRQILQGAPQAPSPPPAKI